MGWITCWRILALCTAFIERQISQIPQIRWWQYHLKDRFLISILSVLPVLSLTYRKCSRIPDFTAFTLSIYCSLTSLINEHQNQPCKSFPWLTECQATAEGSRRLLDHPWNRRGCTPRPQPISLALGFTSVIAVTRRRWSKPDSTSLHQPPPCPVVPGRPWKEPGGGSSRSPASHPSYTSGSAAPVLREFAPVDAISPAWSHSQPLNHTQLFSYVENTRRMACLSVCSPIPPLQCCKALPACPAAFTFFLFLAPCNQASANLLPAAVASLNIEQDLLFNLFSHLEFLKITRRHANNKTCEWEAGMHIKTPAEKCLMCKFTWHFFC